MTVQEALDVLGRLAAERRSWEAQNLALRRVAELLETAQGIPATVSGAEARLAELQGQIAGLEQEYSNMRTAMEKRNAETASGLERRLGELRDRIAAAGLQAEKVEAEAGARVTAAQAKLAVVVAELKEKETLLDKLKAGLADFKRAHGLG